MPLKPTLKPKSPPLSSKHPRLLPFLLCAILAAAACRSSSREFSISGTVSLSPYLQSKAPHGDNVLFIIAKTKGGIPVAVRRVVNPAFPVEFSLNPDDLIVPGAQPKERLWLQAQLNTHGKVGAQIKGDFEGDLKNSVRPGKRSARIIIDREI